MQTQGDGAKKWLRGGSVFAAGALAMAVISNAANVVTLVGWSTGKSLPDMLPSASAGIPEQGSQASDDSYKGGWGPERETFTMGNPATYVALNSITDNPNWGDERNFVALRGSDRNIFSADEVTACPGDTVEVTTYLQNDAADNLDQLDIQGLRMRMALFDGATRSAPAYVAVTLDAKNIKEIWDGAAVVCKEHKVKLTLVNGSGRIHSCCSPQDGIGLPELASGEWQSLGYKATDGSLPLGKEKGTYTSIIRVVFELAVSEED
ncbi:hypothetical protein ATK74_0579 [Propionicimonas paludicola]|uniref:Uncharacterized protein n=1 Tax=Propionicimonas paludicola TaxID=185243 RepID=A0A2A9CQX3_9ACTN|nr:hypothetical protein [Propionicimonas paludicola]PFG16050.1 hypothetical protein ATK74_0579 [Propionicimonas paludicola]